MFWSACCNKSRHRGANERSVTVSARHFKKHERECWCSFLNLWNLHLRPCMQQLVTSFLSTTSSQDIFLHLWVLNFQTCPTALQLCPSVGLTMLHPRESVVWSLMSWYASYASVAFECIGTRTYFITSWTEMIQNDVGVDFTNLLSKSFRKISTCIILSQLGYLWIHLYLR